MTAKNEFPEIPHVAICIATYKRPEGLRTLLASIDAQQFASFRPRITLVIADNAPQDSAAATLGDISGLTRWPVIYEMQPVRGIVAARNCTLDRVPDDADFVVFVDDDEHVSTGWLEAMLTTMRDTDATAVQGPVEPDYDQPPPRWIEDLNIFRLGPFRQGQILNFAATNNSMLNAATLRDYNLRFDMRFNKTGGEDEEFYGRVRGTGGVIRAAAGATVFDSVPYQRMSLRWVIRRSYRKGNTLGRIAILRKRGGMKRIAKGFGVIVWGIGAVILSVFGPRARYINGLMEICRGVGMLGAFLNIRYAEYSDTAVGMDRQPGTHHEG